MKAYFLKISLRGISPMVWRRLRIPGTASLAMLHNSIQIINDWDDSHLNQFRIFGKDYGIYHDGGISFNEDAHAIYIDDFEFDVGDKFTYEYNFFEHIMHDIRIEKIMDLPATKNLIYCISGSGMPGATKQAEWNVKFSLLKKIVKKKGKLSYKDIRDFQEKIRSVKFIKRYINKKLASLSNE
jgi:Plasmid pRiA4b ORF-3-like protein